MHLLRMLRRRWAYLLVLSPVLTDWLEVGHLPERPREFITEVVIGALLAGCIHIIYRDIDRLRTMAETDALTGLGNRHRFMHDLAGAVAVAQRFGHPLALVYVDVDDFKQVNDHYGHDEGDEVLRAVAQLLRGAARREIDGAYRIGGDEFAVLLVGLGTEAAEALMHRREGVDPTAWSYLSERGVGLSFGAAELRPGEATDQFIRRADRMMYDCKHGRGGHRSVVQGGRRATGNVVPMVLASQADTPHRRPQPLR